MEDLFQRLEAPEVSAEHTRGTVFSAGGPGTPEGAKQNPWAAQCQRSHLGQCPGERERRELVPRGMEASVPGPLLQV